VALYNCRTHKLFSKNHFQSTFISYQEKGHKPLPKESTGSACNSSYGTQISPLIFIIYWIPSSILFQIPNFFSISFSISKSGFRNNWMRFKFLFDWIVNYWTFSFLRNGLLLILVKFHALLLLLLLLLWLFLTGYVFDV